MVIRIPNWLGDALMATPVYDNLKEVEIITLFGPPSFLTLFEDFPKVETAPYYKGDFSTNLATLIKYGRDKGLLLTNSFSSAWLFFRAGLKERYGYRTDMRGLLLTKGISPPKEKMHQRDKYLYLVEKLGYNIKSRDLILYLREEKKAKAKSFLGRYLTPEKDNFVILAPGAAFGPAKRWPEPFFKDLAKRLNQEGFKVFIIGGPQEEKMGSFIAEGLNHTHNLCGKTELSLLAGLLTHAKLLISNDSGLMHLAAALRIPQIAIFGSTDPELTGPLNPRARILRIPLPCAPCFRRRCPKGHYRCLTEIKPQVVFGEAIELLQK